MAGPTGRTAALEVVVVRQLWAVLEGRASAASLDAALHRRSRQSPNLHLSALSFDVKIVN